MQARRLWSVLGASENCWLGDLFGSQWQSRVAEKLVMRGPNRGRFAHLTYEGQSRRGLNRTMKHIAWNLLTIAGLALSSGLAGPVEGSTEPAADLSAHAGEPYVFERSTRSYRFEANGTGRVVAEARIRVLNEAGVQQLGQLIFPYVAGQNRLELDSLSVRKPDGSITQGSPDSARDFPAPVTAQFPVYSDARVLHVTIPAFRPGDTLEYRVINHLEEPVAPNRFWMAEAFEKNTIVLEETLEVNVPAKEPIRLDFADGMAPEITESRDRRIYRWTHANIAREQPDPDIGLAGLLDEQALGLEMRYDIELSNFRDWQEVGAWYATLQGDRATPGRVLRRQAEKLVEGLVDDRAKVEAIYSYVTTEFRYLALLFGASRYQPHPAAEVLENGYGDCKDKHTLLAALLDAAGYRSSAVLIGSLGELNNEIPSPHPFDHVITAVPLGDETLWLDSSQIAPFGYLNPALRGKTALRIPPGGTASLVEVPMNLPFTAETAFTFKGEVDEAGRLTGRVQYLFRGDEEFVMRQTFLNLPQAGWMAVVQYMNLTEGLGGEVTDLELSDLAAIKDPLSLSYTVTRPEFFDPFSQQQEVKALRPTRLFQPTPEIARGTATAAMELGELLKSTSRSELTLPESFEARAPVTVTIEHDFGSYVSRYSVDGRRLVAEQKIEVKKRQLAPERFREWTALGKTAQADHEQAFTVRLTGEGARTVAAQTDPDSLFRAGSSAAKRKDYEDATNLFTRVVELEPEHPAAWHELGRALVKSGNAEQGADAFRRQLEIDPHHERAYKSLGWALDKAGDAAGAEAAYRTQLERYPLDHYANAQLGEVLEEQEHCDPAMPYLENALSIKSTDAESRMRLGRCYLRLGDRERGVATLEPLVESNQVWSLHAAGYAAIEHAAYETAIALLRRVIELDPDHEYAFNNLGRALRHHGQLDEAIAVLRRQIEINPDDQWAYDNLSRALFEQAKYSEGIAAIRRHLEIVPDDKAAMRRLSSALWHTDQLAAAIDVLHELVELDPAFPAAHSMLGVALFDSNRFGEATEALERAVAIDAHDPAANRTLGVILARQERYAEALPLLEQALAVAPNTFRDQDILEYVRDQVRGSEP